MNNKPTYSPFFLLLRLCVSYRLNPIEKAIKKELFNKHSYQIPQEIEGSWKTFPQFFKYAVVLIFRENSETLVESRIAVLDATRSSEQERRAYLNIEGRSDIKFIFKEKLPNELSFGKKMYLFFNTLILAIVLLFPFIRKRNREKTARIMLELVENELLFKALKKYKCKEVIVFSGFEKDAAFQHYLLKMSGFLTTIIPSSNPISQFYKIVVATRFAFTAPYQLNEYDQLKHQWLVDSMVQWPPFEYHKIPKNHAAELPKNKLGFMSSGMHLREVLGFAKDPDWALERAETELVEMLKNLLKLKLIDDLVVFLHPLEKKNERHLSIAKEFYKNHFGENVQFGKVDQSSRDSFGQVEIAISGFSSVLMERLYGGYKVIFAPMGALENFYSDNRLDRLSINNQDQFLELYSELKGISAESYFKIFALEDYHHHHIQKPRII